jgi:hypothetical protein
MCVADSEDTSRDYEPSRERQNKSEENHIKIPQTRLQDAKATKSLPDAEEDITDDQSDTLQDLSFTSMDLHGQSHHRFTVGNYLNLSRLIGCTNQRRFAGPRLHC